MSFADVIDKLMSLLIDQLVNHMSEWNYWQIWPGDKFFNNWNKDERKKLSVIV